MRAGDSDGGGAVCTGINPFYAWVPLATSFIIDTDNAYWGGRFRPADEVTGYFVRRVVDFLAQDSRGS